MPPPTADIPDVSPADAYDALMKGDARLVDVRTRAEWTFVGLPDLSGTANELLLLEWQVFPDMAIDPEFGQTLESACPHKATALYFLCRSGARSLSAAREMKSRGYEHVYNVADGFEGPPDGAGQRGKLAGWKASSLPWRQT
ncbi:MAG: rhodanese-like domain-containing protein [Acuticoccus sp.]